ncbi:hypothetical protein TrRE_jg6967 [Triparma retinervis]|uniref:RNA helicase n=1 Tax=Triparma retinervis TaxID=2557542 RepID=A0A9W7CGZ8_9STRA|nr:hypothetical protein TrRE_jg6967 [Triparma retinervis]
MVAQPRRIACKGLLDRMRSAHPERAHQFGMRLGHGLRDEDRGSARCWFCTTGYIVRLLANHPSYFDYHTHLIIDEVHERSVDGDLLCLLAKRLLETNPTIKLILMSATLAASSYQEYFSLVDPPIHIKVRNFKITTYFAEDLLQQLPAGTSTVNKLLNPGSQQHNHRNIVKCQYALAVEIAVKVCTSASSVLIFVSGMADIIEIMELFDKLETDKVFNCVPIHGDIPFEEQYMAFEAPVAGVNKIVIATNAAESSITLPDVDYVIDLGTHKQIQYNEKTHRQVLDSTPICKSSAKQRAGRTGRVRDGFVYRLYSRDFFENEMSDFDQGEILRTPLDNVILDLKEIMKEGEIIPVLQDLIEPPSMLNIEASFKRLHQISLLTDPSDESQLTSMGSFVVSLGVDIDVGRFVGLSAQMGLLPEALYVAAACNNPRSPFKLGNPLVHTDCEQYNRIMTDSFCSKFKFDNGSDSEIFQIVNAMLSWDKLVAHGPVSADAFCRKNAVAKNRISPLMQTKKSLQQRVASILDVDGTQLELKKTPTKKKDKDKKGEEVEGEEELKEEWTNEIDAGKLKLLKVILVWVFVENVMKTNPPKNKDLIELQKMISKEDGKLAMSVSVNQASRPLNTIMLAPILNRPEINYDLVSSFQHQYTGYSVIEGNGDEDYAREVKDELKGKVKAAKDYLFEVGLEVVCILIRVKYGEEELGDTCSYSDEESYGDYELEYEGGSKYTFDYAALYVKGQDNPDVEFENATKEQMKSVKDGAAVKSNKRATISIQTSQTIINYMADDASISVGKNALSRTLREGRHFKVAGLGEQNLMNRQEIRFKGTTLREASLGPLMLHQLQAGRYKDQCIIVKGGKGKGGDVQFKVKFPSNTLTFLDSTGRSFLSNNSKVVAKLGLWNKTVHAVAISRLDISTGGSKAEFLTILPNEEWFVQKALLTFDLDLIGYMWNEEGGADDILQTCEDFNEIFAKYLESTCGT